MSSPVTNAVLFLRAPAAAVVLMLASHALWAHTHLTGSVPAAGASLQGSPESLELEFEDAVRLVRLTLIDGEGRPIDLGFQPGDAEAARFRHPLPARLPDGTYAIQWRAIAEDGHVMKGRFEFSVNAPAPPDRHEHGHDGH